MLENMSHDDCIPHIIFYGPPGTGKKTMIDLFLEMLFGDAAKDIKKANYEVSGSGGKITIETIKQSMHHIVIDPKNTNYDRYMIHDIVKEYTRRKALNVYKNSKTFKCVQINNLDNMSYYAQTALRRTIESTSDKCKFVMWCHSLSKVIKPLKSRCVCIRVKRPSYQDLFMFLVEKMGNIGCYLSLQKYYDIIIKSERNIKNAIWGIEMHRLGINFTSEYHDNIKKIAKCLCVENIQKFVTPDFCHDIRNILFNIMITNVDGTEIMKDIINEILNSNINNTHKYNIIFSCRNIEHRIVEGRREIINFDYLIASIIEILVNPPILLY